ncbi:MAG TPA: polyprenyl synthetase family protein [Candidatus Methanoperedenaceae archaeon]|nr:polyprenyl synthetase family protein [Candidatus Methanoperedenaceae archaeon]
MLEWDEIKLINLALEDMQRSLGTTYAVEEQVRHVTGSGGKRIRPAIVLLTGELFGCAPTKAMKAALAIELIHSASLIHDDILDMGVERRGTPSLHEKFGVANAMLCGDYLISKSIELISYYPQEVVADFASAGMRMSEGEMLDTCPDMPDEEMYMDCIRKKTASLFRSSASIGGRIAGAGRDDIERCAMYGEHVGIAYQITDDLVEFLGAEVDKHSIKTSVTLPQIYAVKMAHEDAVDECLDRVMEHVRAAKTILLEFEPGDPADKLRALAEHITVDMLNARGINGNRVREPAV